MEKILAVAIFVVMFGFIIWDRFPRQWVTLISGALVLVLVFGLCMHDGGAIWETLNLSCFAQKGFWIGSSESGTGINWSTIVFIAGMMVMVEGMGHAGIFQWLCLKIAKLVNYRTVPLLLCFMVMSALLAMFIDSITVILFLAAVTAELAKTLYFDPVPMILAEIFCANLGGSATMCGDPPNIIIGTSLGLSFFDFLGNTGVIAGVCLVFTVVYFFLCFRKPLAESEKNRPANVVYPDAASAVKNRAGFYGCGASFLVVAGLERTGCLGVLADGIARLSGGKAVVMVAIILWVSAVASAFVDNIPFAATMVPVIQAMAQTQGIDLHVLAWALSMGTDLGGSATPIGASANVVGTSVAAKNGHPVTWGKYCRYCAPATIMVMAVSMVCIVVRYM